MQAHNTVYKEDHKINTGHSQSFIESFEPQKRETLELIARTEGDILILQQELDKNPIYIALQQQKYHLIYLQQVTTTITQIQNNQIPANYVSPIVDPDQDMSPLQLPASRSQSPSELNKPAKSRAASTWKSDYNSNSNSNSRIVEKGSTTKTVFEASDRLKIKITGYNPASDDYRRVICSIGGKTYDIMNLFTNKVCVSYGFGDCSDKRCSLYHICPICLTVGKRTDNHCMQCSKVSDTECRYKLYCSNKLKCKNKHDVKERFLFLLHPNKDFKLENRNKMCTYYQDPCIKQNCTFAHSKQEQICYICYLKHDEKHCTNFPLYFSYFNNPGPWLDGLRLIGLI